MRNVQEEANAFFFNTSKRQIQFTDMAGVIYVRRSLEKMKYVPFITCVKIITAI